MSPRPGQRLPALRLLLASLLLVSPAACRRERPAPAEGPRVLLVSIDTLRRDYVGAYGAARQTPAIDALAYAGTMLLDAYTPTPTTAVAHASLLTGLHPWRHGVLDNAVPLAPGMRTAAELAKERGIATAAFVSSYVLHERFGLARGFDTYHFAPNKSYDRSQHFWSLGAETTDAALAWIEAHGDQPFFVWVHYFDPHDPYSPPPGFERPATEPVSLAGKELPPEVSSLSKLADMIRGYRGDVLYADAQVGRLVEGLQSLGLIELTAIVVTSDHGEGLGDHGRLTHGTNLFDELVRIPLVVHGPGIPAGQRLSGAAQLEDLMPTLLELLGLPAPDGIDGRSLLPWIEARAPHSPREVVLGRRRVYQGEPDLFFERSGLRKWIGELGREGTVYALDADPRERLGEPASAPEGITRLEAAGQAAGATAVQDLDEESRRALEALGYLDGGDNGDKRDDAH